MPLPLDGGPPVTPTRVIVDDDIAVLAASCDCGMHFAVLEAVGALREYEIHPRFCPFCAARVAYQAMPLSAPAEN